MAFGAGKERDGRQLEGEELKQPFARRRGGGGGGVLDGVGGRDGSREVELGQGACWMARGRGGGGSSAAPALVGPVRHWVATAHVRAALVR